MPSKELLTEELFADWLQHPVTEAVRKALGKKRRENKDAWEEGNVMDLAKDTQMLRNAANIGLCQGYKYIQELTHEQLRGDLEDDD